MNSGGSGGAGGGGGSSVKKGRDFISSPHTPPMPSMKQKIYHSPINHHNESTARHRYHGERVVGSGTVYHHDGTIEIVTTKTPMSPVSKHQPPSAYSPPISKRRKIGRDRSYERTTPGGGGGGGSYSHQPSSNREKDFHRGGGDIMDDKDWHRERERDKYQKRFSRSPSPPGRGGGGSGHHHRSISRRKRGYYSPAMSDKSSMSRGSMRLSSSHHHHHGQPTRRSSRSPSRYRSQMSPLNGRGGRSRSISRHRSRTRTRSRTRSPSTSTRRIDLKEKISDTSLFAELVKDKHKREQALKEILDKKDEVDSAELAAAAAAGGLLLSATTETTTIISECSVANGINNNGSGKVEVNDIPIPQSASYFGDPVMMDAAAYHMHPDHFGTDLYDVTGNSRRQLPPPPPPSSSAGLTASEKGQPIPTITNNNINNSKLSVMASAAPPPPLPPPPPAQHQHSVLKSKSLTRLPMPPGINPADLEDIKSPTPPRQLSPVRVGSSKNKDGAASSSFASNKKKGLLDLPMPSQVPGFEELSGEDEDDSLNMSPPSAKGGSGVSGGGAGKSTAKNKNHSNKPKKRPRILNRKSSTSSNLIRDWGERCVEVFEVIAQIGEGTYGQVRDTFVLTY